MYFITEVTKWDSRRDSAYRLAPLDKGSRDILLNTNRINRVKILGVNKSGFYYFDNPADIRESPGYIECNDAADTISTAFQGTFLTKLIQLPVCKKNDPEADTENIRFNIEGLAFGDRYNPSPDSYSWVVYVDGAFSIRKFLTPYSLEELEAITTAWGDQQYLVYGEEFVLWRKGVRDGKFVLDKTLTDKGFTGSEDTDWENIKSVE